MWGPLHQAVASGKGALVERLLALGADLNATTAHGLVPLEIAVREEQPAMVALLIEAGAAIDGGEFTPLMSASIKDEAALVERLLELGADLERRAPNPYLDNDDTPRNAIEHAESAGAKAVIELLSARHGGGFATLQGATEADDPEAIAALIAAGADPNQVSGEHRRSPLHLARSAAAIKALIAGGAAPNLQDKDGRSPLMTAMFNEASALERVEALLEAGADPNLRDGELEHSLHFAVCLGDPVVVKALLKGGAKAHIKTSNMQPLHVAAAKGDLEIARLLLDAGAKLDAYAYTIHGGQATPPTRGRGQ